MYVRSATITLVGLVTSYLFGATPFWVGFVSLQLLCLFILPFVAYTNTLVNEIWGSSLGRFIGSSRTLWLLLFLHGIGWKEMIFCAVAQVGINKFITILNYLLFHRTLLWNIEDSQWILAQEFSQPINVVQLAGCEVLEALMMRRIVGVQLPILSLAAMSMSTLWFERIIAQILTYVRHKDSDAGSARVFFTHWGPSADTGHWLLQIEGFHVHIFKSDGNITARIERPGRSADRRDDHPIPSLLNAIYIPFRQYGIVGLADDATSPTSTEEWRGFVEDCMDRYSSVNRSCQEFVIFAMYNLCHPPFFNVSDLKSLGPLAICLTVIYGDVVSNVMLHPSATFPGFWEKIAREVFF